jgi:ATP-dependent Clp protease protease subunit
MIHQPSGGAQGMASDIAIQAEEIIKLRARYDHAALKDMRSFRLPSDLCCWSPA